MSKRKESTNSENNDNIESEQEIINVDFDFFNPRDLDFHATKNLLRQLLSEDNILFNLSELSDIIIKQTSFGSMVKTDGIDSDPYAMLTIIDKNNSSSKSVSELSNYILERTKNNFTNLNSKLNDVLQKNSKTAFIISERLINMPTEVVPPMYKLLLEELSKVAQNDSSYDFDNFILISKVFYESQSTIDQEDNQPSKKHKSSKNKSNISNEFYYFHPEDEIIKKHAIDFAHYPYIKPTQVSDSKRTFQDYGILPQGFVMLLNKEGLQAATADMLKSFPY